MKIIVILSVVAGSLLGLACTEGKTAWAAYP